ncbi:Spc98 family-domain-containing protein [Leucosporidium creatinivorum]|uniref:Spindle pole body component n=1 Tax=Leucosporidium creatinivorum TaxID=106004 RepID=A0A1Y2EXG7_9BASI|nr:Spc98 family-domain-containing protein [Leucosporidium creatinivorum]
MFDLRPVDDGVLGSGTPLRSLYPTKSTRFPLAPGPSSAFRLPLIADTDQPVEFVDPVVKSLLRSTALLGEPSKQAGTTLEAEGVFDATSELEAAGEVPTEPSKDIWAEALEPGPAPAPRILSWDSLRTPDEQRYQSPLLSEASTCVWEAENSPFSSRAPTYTHETLITNLIAVSLGLESVLFAWDSAAEVFVWREDVKGKGRDDGRLWGASAQASASLTKPFLAIGTALVRLEGVVKALKISQTPANRSTRVKQLRNEPSSTSHAVSASLSTFLAWVREELAGLQRCGSPSSLGKVEALADAGLLALATRVEPIRTTLDSLATLFYRPIVSSPPYPLLPLATPSLLSHLYDHLHHHLQHSLTPPLLDQAVAAWLLDGAMGDWWRGWEDWLGVREDAKERDWAMLGIEVRRSSRKKSARVTDDEDEPVEADEIEYILHTSQLPRFFPRTVAVELFEAGRALRLLRRAKPSHPLCPPQIIEGAGRGLLWSEGEAQSYGSSVLERARALRRQISTWRLNSNTNPSPLPKRLVPPPPPPQAQLASSTKYPQELAPLFRLFDQPPDSSSSPSAWQGAGQHSAMLEFVSSRLIAPNTMSILPPSTPSLPILLSTSLFEPLRSYAHLPSTSLLTLFFSNLSLASHIQILHSYFLFGDQPFARRLQDSLFAPPEEKEGATLRRRRRRDQKLYGDDQGELGVERETWGTGLGVHLNDRTTWPPGGAELSLTLRTALGDSLTERLERMEKSKEEKELTIWREVEARLSFAYKEGEEEEERKWADPHSLAALDFLYLAYDTPSPLHLVLTPTILSKYNAIFTHLLRLFRIEAVARSIWQDVAKPNLVSTPTGRYADSASAKLLLDSDPPTRRALLALAFEVRGLVSTLCSYSFDAGVEENYQAFRRALDRVEKVSKAREGTALDGDGDEEGEEREAWNLDSLASLHHHFLDRVQQALLLKRSQAALLKVVEGGIFDAVLLLGRKIKEWRRKEGGEGWDEQEINKEILGLHAKLQASATTLTKVLQALDDRGSTSSKKKGAKEVPKELDIPLERGASYVQELLVRIDSNRFYSSREE